MAYSGVRLRYMLARDYIYRRAARGFSYGSAPAASISIVDDNIRLSTEYGFGFFDRYLKGLPAPVFDGKERGLAAYKTSLTEGGGK